MGQPELTRVNPHKCMDMYVRSLQIKQNITPADVIPLLLLPLPLLLSNALLHYWPSQKLTVKKERETEQIGRTCCK